MHFNSGYQRETVPLARHFAEVFADADVVVAPSASCVSMVREFYPRIAEISGADLAQVRHKVYEFTEFLVDIAEVTDVGAYFPHKVTYHPTCNGLSMIALGER